VTAIDYSSPYETQSLQARPAERGEMERMSCPVLWMYERGQAVALWKSSGLISLVPDSFPGEQVVLLRRQSAR
jgi:hypothetical protein